MKMFSRSDNFRQLFKPTDGGYLYYPSRRGGGKLVTEAELKELEAKLGRPTTWLVLIVGLLLCVGIGVAFKQSEKSIFSAGWVMIAIYAVYIFWLCCVVPRLLVKDRPFVAPTRSKDELKAELRAKWDRLSWPLVIAFSAMLLMVAIANLQAPTIGLKETAMLTLCGIGLVLYARVAWFKFQSSRR